MIMVVTIAARNVQVVRQRLKGGMIKLHFLLHDRWLWGLQPAAATACAPSPQVQKVHSDMHLAKVESAFDSKL